MTTPTYTIEGEDLYIVTTALCASLAVFDPQMAQAMITIADALGKTTIARIISKTIDELAMQDDGVIKSFNVDLLNARIKRLREIALETGVIVRPELASTIYPDRQ